MVKIYRRAHAEELRTRCWGGCRGCMLALVPYHAEFPAPLGAESRRELGSTWVSLQPDEDPGVSIAWGSLGAQCGVFCNAQRCQLPPRRRQSCRRWGGGKGGGGKVVRPQERHRKGWCLSQHEALGPFIHPSQQPSSCPDLSSWAEDAGGKAIW